MYRTTNWKSLVDKFHSKLSSWKANLLSFGDRLTLLKSVLGSLGGGGSHNSKKLSWLKWSHVLASFNKRGLDMGSLKSFNLALLHKWRWRFYSSRDSLWVKVIRAFHGSEGGFDQNGCKFNGVWSKIMGSSNYLHSSSILPMDTIRFQVGCGSNIRFWKDVWLGTLPLHVRYNRIFRLERNKNYLVRDHISNGHWKWSWSRNDLRTRNFSYLNQLLTEISHIKVREGLDKYVWSLAQDGMFTVGLLRHTIDDHSLPSLGVKTHWDK
ncbi:hypothetical protein Tco_1292315 [Tanacetum coccineum]